MKSFFGCAIVVCYLVIVSKAAWINGSQYYSACDMCVSNGQSCPTTYQAYPRLSNFIGCGAASKVCCVQKACGKGSQQNRILDGVPSGVCNWPFVAAIRSKMYGETLLTYSTTKHSCSGVFIADQWVLTSPYCILSSALLVENVPSQILVVAGEYNTTRLDIDPLTLLPQDQPIAAEKAFIFPGYKYTTIENLDQLKDPAINGDGVALIKLVKPINGPCAGVVCLPTPAEAQNMYANYDNCVITGWGFDKENLTGKTDVLRQGFVALTSRIACDFVTKWNKLEASKASGMTCQYPKSRNTDSCIGDEGGPIMCYNGNNWVVRGIQPFNVCVNSNFNLFVTNVGPFLQWIQQTMDLN